MQLRRESQAAAGHRGSKPGPAGVGRRLLSGGVVAATFGVAAAMLPGGYNPFGPAKALVLLCAATCIAIGLALEPALFARAIRRIGAQRGAWAGLALVGLACLATATSLDPAQSLVGHYPEYQGLMLLLVSALVGFAAYALAETNGLWRLLGRSASVAMLAIAAYGLVQAGGADPASWARVFTLRRVFSTLGNSSNLGVFLCLALPLVLARARAETGAWRQTSWVAFAGGCALLALSLSRGAWVGALAGALAWMLVEGRAWDRAMRVRVAAIAAGVLIAAVLAVTVLVPGASARLGGLLDPASGTPGWRVEVWSATTRLVAERPLLGFGPGSFRYAFPPIRTAAMQVGDTGVQELDDPHNLFASAAASAGVFALLALAWLLGEALVSAWAAREISAREFEGPALAAALAAGIVALQFHFATLDTAPLLAIMIALALARPTPAEQPASDGATRALRVAGGVLAVALAVSAVAAGGLVLADRELGRGTAALSAGDSWPQARPAFSAAVRLAPWEPAMEWAFGRAASQEVPTAGDAAFADAKQALEGARARLPLDPLLLAQTAEAYVIASVSARDDSRLQTALELTGKAIAADPQNGYRWALQGTALAGLGRLPEAIADFERAVQYAPNDTQAWSALALLYEQTGQPEKASAARQHVGAAQ